MNENGPISLRTHAMLEPVMALVLIAGPWIFGFSDVDDATTVSVVLGVVMLLTGLMTRWRMALVRVIPLSVHRTADILLGIVAIAAPFVLGFGDEGGPTRFLVIMGIAEVGAALMTRWDTRDEFATDGRHRTTPVGAR